MVRMRYRPPDQVLSFATEVDVVWEVQVAMPVQDLLVRLMCRFRTEWWITDKALEHDCTKRPPIALVAVPLLHEDFRRNVVWRTDRGVGLDGHLHRHSGWQDTRIMRRTNFRRFAFQVAIWSLLDIVR